MYVSEAIVFLKAMLNTSFWSRKSARAFIMNYSIKNDAD